MSWRCQGLIKSQRRWTWPPMDRRFTWQISEKAFSRFQRLFRRLTSNHLCITSCCHRCSRNSERSYWRRAALRSTAEKSWSWWSEMSLTEWGSNRRKSRRRNHKRGRWRSKWIYMKCSRSIAMKSAIFATNWIVSRTLNCQISGPIWNRQQAIWNSNSAFSMTW